MTTDGIVSMAAALALACCSGAVHFEEDEDDTSTASDTSVADTVSDAAGDETGDLVGDASADVAVDTIAPDVTPTCISAGCLMFPDGGPPCCADLDYVASCRDPACSPVFHCVDCGNGRCDPHEQPWNCLSDCPSGCDRGATLGYSCGPDESYSCTCVGPECRVECSVGIGGTLWRDTCSNATYGMCAAGIDHAECRHIGTADEGWYTDGLGGEKLLVARPCHDHWDCN